MAISNSTRFACRTPPAPAARAVEGSKAEWLDEMSFRLKDKIPDKQEREELLKAVNYEAKRAGLDPLLVLAIIEAASGFSRYHVLVDPERKGYMSVPTESAAKVASPGENLFDLKANLRIGCTLFRRHLDRSRGDTASAIQSYWGQDGADEFARNVVATYRQTAKLHGKSENREPPSDFGALLREPSVPPAPAQRPAPRLDYCDIEFKIDLETFGEGVTVELRSEIPGNSKVVASKRSRGGHVGFSGLCPGQHFLALGNGDSVSVTPNHTE